MDSFYDVLEFGDDKTFIKNQIMESFDWAEMDGEEGIRKLFNIIHDLYKDNELISSCLIDCIFYKINKNIEHENFDMANAYLNLLDNN